MAKKKLKGKAFHGETILWIYITKYTMQKKKKKKEK
jgi:hypothetical protein